MYKEVETIMEKLIKAYEVYEKEGQNVNDVCESEKVMNNINSIKMALDSINNLVKDDASDPYSIMYHLREIIIDTKLNLAQYSDYLNFHTNTALFDKAGLDIIENSNKIFMIYYNDLLQASVHKITKMYEKFKDCGDLMFHNEVPGCERAAIKKGLSSFNDCMDILERETEKSTDYIHSLKLLQQTANSSQYYLKYIDKILNDIEKNKIEKPEFDWESFKRGEFGVSVTTFDEFLSLVRHCLGHDIVSWMLIDSFHGKYDLVKIHDIEKHCWRCGGGILKQFDKSDYIPESIHDINEFKINSKIINTLVMYKESDDADYEFVLCDMFGESIAYASDLPSFISKENLVKAVEKDENIKVIKINNNFYNDRSITTQFGTIKIKDKTEAVINLSNNNKYKETITIIL